MHAIRAEGENAGTRQFKKVSIRADQRRNLGGGDSYVEHAQFSYTLTIFNPLFFFLLGG